MRDRSDQRSLRQVVGTRIRPWWWLVVVAAVGAAVLTAATGNAPERTEPLAFGVTTPGGARAAGEVDAVEAATGERPSLVVVYVDFTAAPPVGDLDAIAARGATPVVTWEPWDAADPGNPVFAPAHFAAGAHDAYLQQWADALRDWGRPVLLRFAHEQNGDWYPWAVGVGGTTAPDHIAYGFQKRVDAAGRRLVDADVTALETDLAEIAALSAELDAEEGGPAELDRAALSRLAHRDWSPLGAVVTVRTLVRAIDVDRDDEAQPLMPMATISVTEDMATCMRLHALGWRTVYHHETLALGLAPEDLGTMLTQRLRWAQGTVQVMLRENPLVQRGLTVAQRLMYWPRCGATCPGSRPWSTSPPRSSTWSAGSCRCRPCRPTSSSACCPSWRSPSCSST
ncbi:glycosyltransferase family 2 protein [Geodermatophilus sp. SYSU D01105]